MALAPLSTHHFQVVVGNLLMLIVPSDLTRTQRPRPRPTRHSSTYMAARSERLPSKLSLSGTRKEDAPSKLPIN
eukprot:520994-Hanusia_phi.AAC.2